ncbi:MAG: response regulator, partial [Mycobacterium leprae]
MSGIRTLVVDDEPLIAEAHRAFVERLTGFAVVGVVHSGGEALRFVAQHAVDLVLLDFYLPDVGGLDVCRTLRARGHTVDIIAVTSARDLDVVRAAVAQGVVPAVRGRASGRGRGRRARRGRGHALPVRGPDRAAGGCRRPQARSIPSRRWGSPGSSKVNGVTDGRWRGWLPRGSQSGCCPSPERDGVDRGLPDREEDILARRRSTPPPRRLPARDGLADSNPGPAGNARGRVTRRERMGGQDERGRPGVPRRRRRPHRSRRGYRPRLGRRGFEWPRLPLRAAAGRSSARV